MADVVPVTRVGVPAKDASAMLPLLEYQYAVIQALGDHRTIILQWGRGTGKTTLLLLIAMLDCWRWPRMRYLVVAPSYKTLTDAIFATIDLWDLVYMFIHGYSLIETFNRSQALMVLRWRNGSTMTFRTASRANDMRGGTYGGVLIDEGGYVAATQDDLAAIQPVLRGYGPGRLLLGGTPNGYQGIQGVYMQLRDALEEGRIDGVSEEDVGRIYHSRVGTVHNPHFPQEELALLKATLSQELYNQEILAIPSARSGLVYPEFDPAIHIIDWSRRKELRASDPRSPLGWRVVPVIDWGYSTGHVAWMAIRQPDPSIPPTVIVYRDWPTDRQPVEEICHTVARRTHDEDGRYPTCVICDPEDEVARTIARKIFRQYGVPVVWVDHRNLRGVMQTAEYVRRGLRDGNGRATLFVTRECAAQECNLPGGRGSVQSVQHYKMKGPKPFDDNWHTHAMDCWRMGYINFGRNRWMPYVWPLESLTEQCRVATTDDITERVYV